MCSCSTVMIENARTIRDVSFYPKALVDASNKKVIGEKPFSDINKNYYLFFGMIPFLETDVGVTIEIAARNYECEKYKKNCPVIKKLGATEEKNKKPIIAIPNNIAVRNLKIETYYSATDVFFNIITLGIMHRRSVEVSGIVSEEGKI